MTPIVLRRSVTARYRRLAFLGAALLFAAFLGVFASGFVLPGFAGVLKGLCPACGALAVVFLWHALFHTDLLWTLDEDEITLRRVTAFGKRTRTWPMRDVVRVRVRKSHGDEWPDTYYVELRLASGKQLKLPRYERQGRSDEIAEQIEALRTA